MVVFRVAPQRFKVICKQREQGYFDNFIAKRLPA